MDVTQALKDAENSLRDFIGSVMYAKYGEDWTKKVGVTPERVAQWDERKLTETRRQRGGTADERILYYADFYDLSTILQKNWDAFSPAFGEWKIMELWLKELGRFRDPDAHRRELLPHQKHLVLGISGEIRSRIVQYRNKLEGPEDYFPRFESVRDNFGNSWVPGELPAHTKVVLRPGDVIEFVASATDPRGGELWYGIARRHSQTRWQRDASLSLRVETKDVSRNFDVYILLKGSRELPADEFEQLVTFSYSVLPVQGLP